MYHPEHRSSRSTASVGGDELNQNIREQEPPYDYRVNHTDILMSEVELNNEAERSPVSPLVALTFPRPVSSISRNSGRQILHREFSFEDTQEPTQASLEESQLNRRTALSSNLPSDWHLAMPSYYGRGFPPQSSEGYQSVRAEHGPSAGRYSAVQGESSEDVQMREN